MSTRLTYQEIHALLLVVGFAEAGDIGDTFGLDEEDADVFASALSSASEKLASRLPYGHEARWSG